jgi:hypothetical protein
MLPRVRPSLRSRPFSLPHGQDFARCSLRLSRQRLFIPGQESFAPTVAHGGTECISRHLAEGVFRVSPFQLGQRVLSMVGFPQVVTSGEQGVISTGEVARFGERLLATSRSPFGDGPPRYRRGCAGIVDGPTCLDQRQEPLALGLGKPPHRAPPFLVGRFEHRPQRPR